MKKEIHPPYDKVVVRCGCGNTFETRSTAKEIHAEICRYRRKNRTVPEEIRHRLRKGQKRAAEKVDKSQKIANNVKHLYQQACTLRHSLFFLCDVR